MANGMRGEGGKRENGNGKWETHSARKGDMGNGKRILLLAAYLLVALFTAFGSEQVANVMCSFSFAPCSLVVVSRFPFPPKKQEMGNGKRET